MLVLSLFSLGWSEYFGRLLLENIDSTIHKQLQNQRASIHLARQAILLTRKNSEGVKGASLNREALEPHMRKRDQKSKLRRHFFCAQKKRCSIAPLVRHKENPLRKLALTSSQQSRAGPSSSKSLPRPKGRPNRRFCPQWICLLQCCILFCKHVSAIHVSQ